MEPEKNNPEPTDGNPPSVDVGADENATQQDPADALSRTPDELEEEKSEQAAAADTQKPDAERPEAKKVSPIKRFFRKVNLYFLIFVLLVVVAGAVTIVNYLNSQNTSEPDIATQALTEDALKQLANTDATVGDASQTLTIQGNAVIKGQTLMQGSLSAAGNFQTGGSITGPNLTISGESNLAKTQINSLQVAQNTAIQGDTTLRDLNVTGASSFGGAMTASKITVSQLILSGNASLQVPNHVSFTGPSPGRSFIGPGILGSGSSASVNGSDTSGTINLNSGNNPSGTGCIVRVNFNLSFIRQPHVIVSPVSRAAGQLQFYVERNTDGFSLCTANTPLANQNFAFDYFVAG